jgi:hypothetical protein
LITAEQAADTLRLLIPGFVALKVFYVLGLRTRRSDLEWALWSLLVAALLDGIANWLIGYVPGLAGSSFVLSLLLGVALAAGGAAAWSSAVSKTPALRARSSRMAWDAVLPDPHWVQVYTTDATVISGKVRYVADPTETDELDLYITEPAWVDAAGNVVEMSGVDGVLIGRDAISLIQVMPNPVETTEPSTG